MRKAIALRAVRFGCHQRFNFLQRVAVVGLGLDRLDIHCSHSDGLRIDRVVLLMRPDKPDVLQGFCATILPFFST